MTFYTTNCSKCKVLKSKLDKLQFTYDVCEDINVMEKLGIQSAPALEVNGKIMNFGEAIKWVKEQ